MKIKIDRYKLLGVAIRADVKIILDQLERRLGKCEFTGFGSETLTKREEILKENTSILTDSVKRKIYDDEFISNNTSEGTREPSITIEKGYEIAVSLLLLEAGEQQECLTLANKLYQEERMNMSYFSSEYKELNRLIDYATLKLAGDFQGRRHYESAALVLEQRIKNQSLGMGEKEMINLMMEELKQLTPYRILDMLSREDNDRNHAKGISLLRVMINDRGGLDSDSDIYMESKEFHAFFRQIRTYLSVQEQIEIFEKLGNEGSKAGRFLHCIALVAQGFTQKKPSRIYESLGRIEEIRSDELEPMIGNMHLLLGNVETACSLFNSYADEKLKEWAKTRSHDTLGGLCEWCREWLKRDVLKGYRDIDGGADLESYFSDKDVVRYIEEQDILRRKTTYADDSCSGSEDFKHVRVNPDKQAITKQKRREKTSTAVKKKGWTQGMEEITRLWDTHELLRVIQQNILIFGIISISSCSLLVFTGLSNKDQRIEDKDKGPASIAKQNKSELKKNKTRIDLIEETLMGWHRLKTKALSENKVPANSGHIATEEVMRQLRSEVKENIRKGQSKVIDVEIKNLRVTEVSPDRTRVDAEMIYSDKRIGKNGAIVEETEKHTFSRTYNLIWDGRRWMIDR